MIASQSFFWRQFLCNALCMQEYGVKVLTELTSTRVVVHIINSYSPVPTTLALLTFTSIRPLSRGYCTCSLSVCLSVSFGCMTDWCS